MIDTDTVIRALRREIRSLERETYDDSGEPHDEGILGRIDGVESAIEIIRRIDKKNKK